MQYRPLKAVFGFLFTGVLGVITDRVTLIKLLIDADGLLLTGFKGTSVPDVNRKDIHSKHRCFLNRSGIFAHFQSDFSVFQLNKL